MHSVMILLLTIGLCSCSTMQTETMKSSEQVMALDHVSLGDTDAYLDLSSPWHFTETGIFLQEITFVSPVHHNKIQLHIEFAPSHLDVKAFHEFVGEVYRLSLKESKISWTSSAKMSDDLQPINIIADIMLVNLDKNTLRKTLKNATLDCPKTDNSETRLIKRGDKIIRTITFKRHKSLPWEEATLYNPQWDYTLTIKAKRLS